MGINKKNLASLVDTVVLPFEKFILEDVRLAKYLSDFEVAKLHNLAIAKLTIYIYSDITSAYAYIQEGTKAHQLKYIPIQNLKEVYSLYFQLCKEWNQNHMEADDRFGKNLSTIEQFVYDFFAKESESKEEFYTYNSEVLKQNIAKMHYKDEAKISAEDFYAEGSIDELDMHDILECSHALSEAVQEQHIVYDRNYFSTVNEHFHLYAVVLEKSIEFRDLGFSLSKLVQFLTNHREELIEHPKKKTALVVLNAIVEDLISWTQNILLKRTAIDIHYLDASLLSSIIQLEMIFAPAKEEDEDVLEFF